MWGTHIRDLYALELFKGTRLIAGDGGLDNAISNCGLLDYEYDSSMRKKYFHSNFVENQLVLTSLLHAKNNEALLDDAVKSLVNRGCSGLMIKNVFKLPIHDNVLRYADVKDFPIFVIKDDKVFFEDIIYEITDLVHQRSKVHFYGNQADEIIKGSFSDEEQTELAYKINPSFMSDVVCFFCYSRDQLHPSDYLKIISQESMEELISHGDRIFYYKNGAMLVHTSDLLSKSDVDGYIELLSRVFHGPQFNLGISEIHHSLVDIKSAMTQAIYSALLHPDDRVNAHFYSDLGSLKAIIPYCDQGDMLQFSQQYLKPVFEYDIGNNVKLFDTVRQFVMLGGELEPTAQRMGQHKNTIRYRLDILNKILGINIFSRQDYEIMAMAIRIWVCGQAVKSFGKHPFYWEISGSQK